MPARVENPSWASCSSTHSCIDENRSERLEDGHRHVARSRHGKDHGDTSIAGLMPVKSAGDFDYEALGSIYSAVRRTDPRTSPEIEQRAIDRLRNELEKWRAGSTPRIGTRTS